MEPATGETFWGTVAASVLAALIAIWRAVSKLRRDNKVDASEVDTLRALDAAVVHWRELYDAAWNQAVKERALREKAELRTSEAFNEIEKLRSEVAALRREIEKLTATLRP